MIEKINELWKSRKNNFGQQLWPLIVLENGKKKDIIPNVAFLAAEDENSFKSSTQGLAVPLGINKALPIKEIFKKIFELYNDHPLLLILDNLEMFEVIKKKSSSKVYILATSQNRGLEQKFKEYQLDFLNKDDSKNLIKSILGENFIQILSTYYEI